MHQTLVMMVTVMMIGIFIFHLFDSFWISEHPGPSLGSDFRNQMINLLHFINGEFPVKKNSNDNYDHNHYNHQYHHHSIQQYCSRSTFFRSTSICSTRLVLAKRSPKFDIFSKNLWQRPKTMTKKSTS